MLGFKEWIVFNRNNKEQATYKELTNSQSSHENKVVQNNGQDAGNDLNDNETYVPHAPNKM